MYELGTVLKMEVQPLKDIDNAVIHLYIMLSALRLIRWRAGLRLQSLSWSQGPCNPSIQGVIVYMGHKMMNFIYEQIFI